MSSISLLFLTFSILFLSWAPRMSVAQLDCTLIEFSGFYATTCTAGLDGFPDCQSNTAAFAALYGGSIEGTFLSSPSSFNPSNVVVNQLTLNTALAGTNLFVDVYLATDNGAYPSNFSIAYLPNGRIPTSLPSVSPVGYSFVNDPLTNYSEQFQFMNGGDPVELTQIAGNNHGAFTTSTLLFINVTEQYLGSNMNGPVLYDCYSIFYFNITNPRNSSNIVGDPLFKGLRGQSFQVHGISGLYYNLISDSTFSLNSKFTFLSGPRPCPIIPSTNIQSVACWSHPGSYLSEIGLLTVDNMRILIIAGSASMGFKSVQFNGIMQSPGTNSSLVSYSSTHELTLTINSWIIHIENSDMFLNIQSILYDGTSPLRSHGLLGQTWSNRRYNGRIKEIEGEVDDYIINENHVFGTDFVFNKFKIE